MDWDKIWHTHLLKTELTQKILFVALARSCGITYEAAGESCTDLDKITEWVCKIVCENGIGTYYSLQ